MSIMRIAAGVLLGQLFYAVIASFLKVLLRRLEELEDGDK